MDYQYAYKIILLGDTAVGKTSFCKQYIDQLFNPLFKSTIGIEYGCKFITQNNKKTKLHIWDTAGQEIYRSITKSYYRESAGVLLLYDITDLVSFYEAKRWYTDIKKYLGDKVPVVLVGNKRDLEGRRKVLEEEAREWANERGIKFIESTATEYESVEETFLLLIHQINKLLDEYLEESQAIGGKIVSLPSGIRIINNKSNDTINTISKLEFKETKSYCGGCL